MKIKAFGMDIQVTESAVFVNGKEVYNKIDQEIGDNDRPMTKLNLSNMHNYSSVSSLIEPKDEGDKERFDCYEMHAYSRFDGCVIQCKECEDKEQRMNVIGQNGNDGLHYGFWEDMNNDLMDNNRNEGIWDTDN